METNHHQNSPPQHIFVQPGQIFEDTPDENRFMKKVKSGPMLPLGMFLFLFLFILCCINMETIFQNSYGWIFGHRWLSNLQGT